MSSIPPLSSLRVLLSSIRLSSIWSEILFLASTSSAFFRLSWTNFCTAGSRRSGCLRSVSDSEFPCADLTALLFFNISLSFSVSSGERSSEYSRAFIFPAKKL